MRKSAQSHTSTDGPGRSRLDRGSALVAPALILVSGLVDFVLHHGYGLLRSETLLACAVVAGAALVLGAILAGLPSGRLRAAVLCVVLFLFLDLQYRVVDVLHRVVTGQEYYGLGIAGLILGLFACFLAIMSLHVHLPKILAATFAMVLASTILIPREPAPLVSDAGPGPDAELPQLRGALPPIVHVILDGHSGVEGLPTEIEGGRELRRALERFYLDRGFRLFGRAYSEYSMTRHALRVLLNASATARIVEAGPGADNRWILRDNRYFAEAVRDGYRIRVYQTEYLRYCESTKTPIESCYTYSGSDLRLMRDLDLSAAEKAEFMIGAYLFRSRPFVFLLQGYDRLRTLLEAQGVPVLPRGSKRSYDSHSLGTLDALRRLERDLASDEPFGRLYFAHLMLPHAPFFLTSDCRMRDLDDWYSRKLYHRDLESGSSSDYRREAYERYFAQTTCLLKRLGSLFDAMTRAGSMDRATIVVHGDHGSRITLHDPVFERLGDLTPRDLIDAYSTLFAIRAPGLAAGYERRMASIQRLFAEFVLHEDRAAPAGRIFLAPTERFPMRPHRMPNIGEARTADQAAPSP